ncbi:MAG: HIG1 domain-containing protein [Parvibaculales bacterium]
MESFSIVLYILMAVLVLVLLAGVWNMIREGSASRSQLFMRWRVLVQFAILCLLALVAWVLR